MSPFPPNVRIALKSDDLHVLLPGDLAGPFRRSGYEIREYLPQQSPEPDHQGAGSEESR